MIPRQTRGALGLMRNLGDDRYLRLLLGGTMAAIAAMAVVHVLGVGVREVDRRRTVSTGSSRWIESATVIRVIDGDTLVMASGERVRLLGVDAPELASAERAAEAFAPEAARYLRDRTLGREISLEYEAGNTRDRYGRLLAYVHLDGSLVNRDLIEEGYAHAYTRHRYERLAEFLHVERDAREGGRGIWALETQ